MTEEIECPEKDLEDILIFVDPFFIELSSVEPDTEIIEKIERIKNPNVSKRGLQKAFKEHVELYVEEQKAISELVEEYSKYGKTSKEIIGNLNEHFKRCEWCREFYLKRLDKKAASLLDWAKKTIEKNESNGSVEFAKGILPKGYQKLVKEYDILGFLNS